MSLESLLTTLREYKPNRLVCLFGCGGNRSRDRRFEMGEVSGKLADLTIITSDNPRNEEPQAIIDDIKTGYQQERGKYVEITIGKKLCLRHSSGTTGRYHCNLQEKVTKTIRRSKERNIRWMNVY